ncbi:glycosyltransferase family 2 protein [Marinomonas sp. A79]|uniref:Glycosyltransferase family 2 protein n=1 Tax=Marinomonas vulgaris TaxID=2823372 RepID=A0ABS5H770_9GAMM|nr:glycosyltransferase family 2 protein [Marinomonas vulgaris]MBR7887577.1 glycosyltransferase family 2 protein [Marinomonas vulgaris]
MYSIVIPHYNCIVGLESLILSIPARSEIEIIIVDDNSNCSVENIIDEFSNHNIFIYTNDSGVKGAGACRNIGLNAASGKYVLFADSDDYFVDNAFDSIDCCKGDEDIVFFKATSFCVKSGGLSDRHTKYCDIVDQYILKKDKSILYDFVVPWGKLYNRRFLVDNSIYFDEVIASNDVMFSMRSCWKSREIKVVPETIYCVTRDKGTLTTTFSKEVLSSRYFVELSKIDFIFKNKIKAKKSSAAALVYNYFNVMSFKVILDASKLLIYGKICFFPIKYIVSPLELLKTVRYKKMLKK